MNQLNNLRIFTDLDFKALESHCCLQIKCQDFFFFFFIIISRNQSLDSQLRFWHFPYPSSLRIPWGNPWIWAARSNLYIFLSTVVWNIQEAKAEESSSALGGQESDSIALTNHTKLHKIAITTTAAAIEPPILTTTLWFPPPNTQNRFPETPTSMCSRIFSPLKM